MTTNIATSNSALYNTIKDYAHKNRVQQRLRDWKRNLYKSEKKVTDNTHRLQRLEKKAYGKNVANVYQENDLRRIIVIESYLLIGFTFVAASSAFIAIYEPIYLISTIFTGWFATIAFRFLRHHSICLHHLQSISSQRCPYCGKSLFIRGIVTATPC